MIASKCSAARFARFAAVVIAMVVGCGEEDAPTKPAVVLLNLDDDSVRLHPAVENYPIVDPKTGKATLVPAMYCASCQRWRPVPGPERINRVENAGRCRVCGGVLVPDGPLPNDPDASSR